MAIFLRTIVLVFLLVSGPLVWANGRCIDTFKKNIPLRDSLTLAAVAYEQTGGVSEQEFFANIESHLLRAKRQGSEWVIFPELVTLDLLPRGIHDNQVSAAIRQIFTRFTPVFKQKMIELANEFDMHILTGSTPLVENGKVYNVTYFISPGGEVVEQRKIFLTPFEKDWDFSPGTELKVFDTPWGRSAILICLDCEMPILSNLLAEHRVELIMVPSMTEGIDGYRRVRYSAQARAIEHRAYVVHVGVTGRINNWPNYGRTSVLTPSENGMSGTEAEGQGLSDEILVQTLNFADLRRRRAAGGIDPAREQNERQEPIAVNIETVLE